MLSVESIKPLTISPTSGMTFFNGSKIKTNFNETYLKEETVTFHHSSIVKVYIVHDINLWPNDKH